MATVWTRDGCTAYLYSMGIVCILHGYTTWIQVKVWIQWIHDKLWTEYGPRRDTGSIHYAYIIHNMHTIWIKYGYRLNNGYSMDTR